MTRYLIWCVVAGMVCFAVTGCRRAERPRVEPDHPAVTLPTFAMEIEDGAVPYFPTQYICPVCEERIKAEHYADVDGKRIYFDRAECADTFKRSPAGYMEKLRLTAQ